MMMTMMILLQSRENYNTMLGVLLGGFFGRSKFGNPGLPW
jgi:hypothetical protein